MQQSRPNLFGKNKVVMNFKSFLQTAVLIFYFLVSGSSVIRAEVRIDPSVVYIEVEKIGREIDLLKKHFKISQSISFTPYEANLKPKHTWQLTYIIFSKINIFRSKINLPRIMVNSMEPVLDINPLLTFEQTQRLLAEIAILKIHLGITQYISSPGKISGKQPIDVFNQLQKISLEMDLLNKELIHPTYVFSEVMRIDTDISSILRWLKLEDTSYPPAKEENVTPKDSLDATYELMEEIYRLQRILGVGLTDFSLLRRQGKILPSDVYLMVGMCLAELQPVKARMGISILTPPAESYDFKTPADVHQLIQWSTKKLQLVRISR